jgi:O-antigen/teichoic acid export membrane protein
MDEIEPRSNVFWKTFISRVVTLAVAYIFYVISLFLFFPSSVRFLYILQSFFLVANVLDVSWFFNGIENFKITVTRGFVVKILTVVLIFSFVKEKTDLPIYVLILSLGTVLGNMSLIPFLKGELSRMQINSSDIPKTIFRSLPYFIPVAATSVYLILNKLMIGWMDSDTHAGFFNQSDQIIRVILSLVTALNAVMLPKIANDFKNKNQKKIDVAISRSISLTLFFSIPVIFGVVAVSNTFAPIFFGSPFSEVGQIMAFQVPMVLFVGLNNVIGWQYMVPVGMVRKMSVTVIVGAIFNLFGNLFVIPRYGVLGSTVITVLSEAIILFVMMYYVRKVLDFRKMFAGAWKYILSGLIMFGVILFEHTYVEGISFLIISVLSGSIIYLLFTFLLKTPIFSEVLVLSQKFRRKNSDGGKNI